MHYADAVIKPPRTLSELEQRMLLKTSGARRRATLTVFKGSGRETDTQEIVLPDLVRAKLEKLYRWKQREGQDLSESAHLFVSRKGNRLSIRQLRHAFGVWQERVGFDHRLSVHALLKNASSSRTSLRATLTS